MKNATLSGEVRFGGRRVIQQAETRGMVGANSPVKLGENVKNGGNYGGEEYLEVDSLRYLTGYVEQFDTLVGELTVRQMLDYTAQLKLT